MAFPVPEPMVRVPPRVVAPVTPSVPPTEALFVTLSAVPAPLSVKAPENVGLPEKVPASDPPPLALNVVNAPVLGVVFPTGVLLSDAAVSAPVTPRVPPIVALFVTLTPIPAALNVCGPPQVFVPLSSGIAEPEVPVGINAWESVPDG